MCNICNSTFYYRRQITWINEPENAVTYVTNYRISQISPDFHKNSKLLGSLICLQSFIKNILFESVIILYLKYLYNTHTTIDKHEAKIYVFSTAGDNSAFFMLS